MSNGQLRELASRYVKFLSQYITVKNYKVNARGAEAMKYSVWLESENWTQCDDTNDNSDVIVTFDNGDRWMATFITYENLKTIVRRNKVSGENLSGLFFWADSMILAENICRDTVEIIIKELITTSAFYSIFNKIKEQL